MKKALVIGGTGMLADLSLWLASGEYHVSVLARNKQKMDHLIQKVSSSVISPIYIDYKNEKALREDIKKLGGVDLVVAWIHSDAPNALNIIIEELSINTQPWRLFQVVGSGTDLTALRNTLNMPENVMYNQIKLGFVIENGRSRWLTNQEISRGVMEAIASDISVQIVGTVEPWEKRPN